MFQKVQYCVTTESRKQRNIIFTYGIRQFYRMKRGFPLGQNYSLYLIMHSHYFVLYCSVITLLVQAKYRCKGRVAVTFNIYILE